MHVYVHRVTSISNKNISHIIEMKEPPSKMALCKMNNNGYNCVGDF